MIETRAASAPERPLRLWPGTVALAVQWAAWFGVSLVRPEGTPWGMVVALYAGLAFVAWWLLLSRAPWLERVVVLGAAIVASVATRRLVHESVAGGGMGFLLYLYLFPLLNLALLVAAAVGRRAPVVRRATFAGGVLLVCGAFSLLRTGGVTGYGDSDFHWRWTPTPEERLLGRAAAPAAAVPVAPAPAPAGAEWPGFRGATRDGVVRGVALAADWSSAPPVELWRRPIGPGWSSFAVRGARVYTQEQRGDDELVACYALATGAPVWTHADPVRFYESNAGAGPRATPTLGDGRVVALGATGLVNVLDEGSGAVVWRRDAAADTGVAVPDWGFAGSPLLTRDLVVVAAAGRLVAYDAATGAVRWTGPEGGVGYSSPHLATFDGVEQIVLLSGGGAVGIAPADGAVLWQEPRLGNASIVQPGRTADGDVLITAAYEMGGTGLRRLAVARGAEGWTVAERWASRGLKPYFNDFVVHGGHAYGLDNGILTCVDLADGERAWRDGRYGHGQVLLLADAAQLLVLSEEGELVLVAARPDAFEELARAPALIGKTWNHPVLAGDVLLVRNAEEMAAFRVALADG